MCQYPNVLHTIAYDVLISGWAIPFLFFPFLQEYLDAYFKRNHFCRHIFKGGLSVCKKKEKKRKMCSCNIPLWNWSSYVSINYEGWWPQQKLPLRRVTGKCAAVGHRVTAGSEHNTGCFTHKVLYNSDSLPGICGLPWKYSSSLGNSLGSMGGYP